MKLSRTRILQLIILSLMMIFALQGANFAQSDTPLPLPEAPDSFRTSGDTSGELNNENLSTESVDALDNFSDFSYPLAVELLANGGFEVAGEGKVPANWTGLNLLNGDKQRCGLTNAFEGSCVFQFNYDGLSNFNRILKQNIRTFPTPLGVDDELTYSLNVRSGNLSGKLKARAVIVYADGTRSRIKMNLTTPTSGYQNLSGSTILTGDVTRIITKVILAPNTTGRIRVDGVSLQHVDALSLAGDDAYTTTLNTPLNIPAPGVLANDELGSPPATVVSFGGGSLGGDATTYPADGVSPAAFSGDGSVTMAADGSFVLTPPTGFTGVIAFDYQIQNINGSDTATVLVNVENVPDAIDDAYTILNTDDLSDNLVANDDLGFPFAAFVSFGLANADETAAPNTITGAFGSLTVNADGTFTYNPDAAFSGDFTFFYRLTNTRGTDTAAVTITVNRVPTANDDHYSIFYTEDLTVPAPGVMSNDDRGYPLANVVSFGGSAFGFGNATTYAAGTTVFGPDTEWTVFLGADGTLTLDPEPPFTGVITFDYIIENAAGTSQGTITISVEDAPDAVDDSYTTLNTAVLNDDLTSNDNRAIPVADVVSFGSANADETAAPDTLTGGFGSLTVNADGTFSYDPDAAFSGDFTFYYRLTNIQGTDTAAVTITVNRLPTATDDSYLTLRNNSLTVVAPGVMSNDDRGFPLANVVSFGGGSLGGDATAYAAGDVVNTSDWSLTLGADGNLYFEPTSVFTGVVTFDYIIENIAGTSTGTITISVEDAPDAVDDAATILNTDVLNDSLITNDDQGYPLADVVSFGTTTADDNTTPDTLTGGFGSLTVNADGTFSYDPDAAFTGNFTFYYRLTNTRGTDTAAVTITVNRLPTANDDSYSTLTNVTLTVAAPGIMNNDDRGFPLASVVSFGGGSLGGDATTYFVNDGVTTPVGTFNLGNDGSLSYNPQGYVGLVTFDYILQNAAGTSTGTITISVEDVPDAIDDSYTILNADVLNDDLTSNDDLGYPVADVVSFGTTTADDNTAPDILTGGFGSLTVNADGTFTYDPADGFYGDFTFYYRLTNSRGTDTAAVTITVAQLPDAVDDGTFEMLNTDVATDAGFANLLTNDTVGTPAASIVSFGGGTVGGTVDTNTAGNTVNDTWGSLTVNGDGTFSFDPDDAYEGTFTVEYRIENITGSDVATVTFNVSRIPVATDDSYTTAYETTLTVNAADANDLLDNDNRGYPVGDIVSFGGGSLGGDASTNNAGTPVNFGTSGTLTVNADGSFIFTPDTGYEGSFTFAYIIENAAGQDTGTVTINVDRAPYVLSTDPADTDTDIVVNTNIVITFSEAVTVSGAWFTTDCGLTTANSAVTGNGTDTITINPDSDLPYNTTCTVTIVGAQVSDVDTVDGPDTMEVDFAFGFTTVPQPPVAVDDAFDVRANISISVPEGASDLLANDSGIPVPSVIPASGTTANGGQYQVFADGSFTYNPAAGFTGADSFDYQITNGSSGDTGTVNLTVAGSVVFFIDDNAAGGGTGRLSDPFNTIAAFNASAAPEAGDSIYVFSGTYTDAITLLANQKLLGQGYDLTTLTGMTPMPAFSASLPATSTNPTIANVTLATGNTVSHVDIVVSSGVGVSGNSVGAVVVDQVTVSGTGESAITINGGTTITASIPTVNFTGATANQALRITSFTGASTISFGDVNINGGALNAVFFAGMGQTDITLSSLTAENTGETAVVVNTAKSIQIDSGSITGVEGLFLSSVSSNGITLSSLTSTDGPGLTAQNVSGTGAISITNAAVTNTDIAYTINLSTVNPAVNINALTSNGVTGVFASSATLNISGGSIIAQRSAIVSNGSTLGINLTTLTAQSTNTVEGIVLTSTTGSVNAANGTISTAPNSVGVIAVTGGSVDFTYGGTFTRPSGFSTNLDVKGGHTGTLTFNGPVTFSSGGTFGFNNADGTYNFTGAVTGSFDVSITNGSSGTINMGTVANNAALSGTATGITVASSTPAVTYTGTITRTNGASNNPVIDIDSMTAGSFTLTGTVTNNDLDSGAVEITNSSANVTVTNLDHGTSGARVTAAGILLSSYTGTASFTTVDLYTTNLSAIDGTTFGTLNIGNNDMTGNDGVVNTSGAGAIVLTTGTAGIELTSLSSTVGAGGTLTGLTNASRFKVLGTGSTDASGGTISNTTTNGFVITNSLFNAEQFWLQNMTFSSIGTSNNASCDTNTTDCHAAIKLNNTSNITLSNVDILNTADAGIYGTAVNGMTIANSSFTNTGAAAGTADGFNRHALSFRKFGATNLTGVVSIANTTFTGGADDYIAIENTSGSLSLFVNNVSFGSTITRLTCNADSQDCDAMGIAFKNRSSASSVVDVVGSTFTNVNTGVFIVSEANNSDIDIDIETNTFTLGSFGVSDYRSSDKAIVLQTLNATNQTMEFYVDGNQVPQGGLGSMVFVRAAGNGDVMNGLLRSNTLTASALGNGIEVNAVGPFGTEIITMNIGILNNIITQTDLDALYIGSTPSATINADVSGNTASVAPSPSGSGSGIFVYAEGTTCARIASNNANDSNPSFSDIAVYRLGTGPFTLNGFGGGDDNAADNYLVAQNPGKTVDVIGPFAGGTCNFNSIPTFPKTGFEGFSGLQTESLPEAPDGFRR